MIITEELFNVSFDPFFSGDADDNFYFLVKVEDDDGYWVSTTQVKEMDHKKTPNVQKQQIGRIPILRN